MGNFWDFEVNLAHITAWAIIDSLWADGDWAWWGDVYPNIINRVCATYLAGAANEEGIFVPGQRFESKNSAN